MGTSKRFAGPSSGLVPSWVDDPVPPVRPRPTEVPPVLPDTPDTPSVPTPQPQSPENPPPHRPLLPDTSGAGEFTAARRNFSRFARTGSRTALGRALSNYVRKGTGGGRRAAHRMGSSRATAAGLLAVVRDFQRFGPDETLRRLNLSGLSGAPAADVFVAILEFVCPPGGAVDEAIARQAMLESVGDMAEASVGSFDLLTIDQMRDFFLDFVARSIEGQVMAELGNRGMVLSDDVSAVEHLQAELHDYVTGATRGQLLGRLDNLDRMSDPDIQSVVNQIYETAFDLVAAAGEDAA